MPSVGAQDKQSFTCSLGELLGKQCRSCPYENEVGAAREPVEVHYEHPEVDSEAQPQNRQ